jgi:hypothetical protein
MLVILWGSVVKVKSNITPAQTLIINKTHICHEYGPTAIYHSFEDRLLYHMDMEPEAIHRDKLYVDQTFHI